MVSYAEELATSFRRRAYPPAAGIIPVCCAAKSR